jgi:4-aminobutyrate aminotransferase-like enzyme
MHQRNWFNGWYRFYGKRQNIIGYCMDKGLTINCTNDTVLRLSPPLIITKQDVDFAIKILEESLKCQTTK